MLVAVTGLVIDLGSEAIAGEVVGIITERVSVVELGANVLAVRCCGEKD